jgi:hypothetical protein
MSEGKLTKLGKQLPASGGHLVSMSISSRAVEAVLAAIRKRGACSSARGDQLACKTPWLRCYTGERYLGWRKERGEAVRALFKAQETTRFGRNSR